MKRWSKLSVTAICVVAAASLATGLAGADTTTTTDPLTLCVNKVTHVVVAPTANGQCNKKAQSAIQVASGPDVSALASRLDADEAKQSSDESTTNSQGSIIAAMQTKLAILAHAGTLVISFVSVSPNCAGVDPAVGTVCTLTLLIEGLVVPSSTVTLVDDNSQPVAQFVAGSDGVIRTNWTTDPFTCTGNLNLSWQARGRAVVGVDLLSNSYTTGC